MQSLGKSSHIKKKKKLLKQQEMHDEQLIDYQPGKVQIKNTPHCSFQVVNFFGDIHSQVYCLNVSPDHENVAVGCSTGDIKVYNIYEGKIILMGSTSKLSGYPNTGIKWNPTKNKQFTACNCDGAIKWYHIDQKGAIGHHESQYGYLCAGYGSDGSWSVYGNQIHELEIFDSVTKKLLTKYGAGTIQSLKPNHFNRIFSVKGIKGQPNLFYSGGWDSSVRLWDIRVPDTSVRKFGGPLVSADSLDLKNNVLLVGNYSTKQNYQFWDFTSGKLIQNINIHQQEEASYCFAASYSHYSTQNLSAGAFSGINKIKIFNQDIMIGQLKFQATPLCLDFYRFYDKNCLIASGVEGTIYAIKFKIQKN